MTDERIYKKIYSSDIPVNEREIWRYAGYAGASEKDEEIKNLLEEVIKELSGSFDFKVCYRRLALEWRDELPVMPLECRSADLAKCLKGSREAVLFAATIGHEIDRKIMLYQRISPTKALLAQAYGAERIEALCDEFCREMEKEAARADSELTPRYSPGYGDWPLEIQKQFFEVLDIYHQIGISLGDSLLMRPSKSVTAVFGIRKREVVCPAATKASEGDEQAHKAGAHNCNKCNLTDCEYRQTME